MKLINLILLCLCAFVFLCNCSNSTRNPTEPAGNEIKMDILGIIIDGGTESQSLAGSWKMNFDSESLNISIEDNRGLDVIWNVTMLLPPPTVVINSFDPISGILDIDFTIQNPTSVTAYDVRAIIYSDNFGMRLTNGDDWTGQFDIPGGPLINPFKAFAKNETNREFTGMGTEHTQRMQLYFPAGVTMLDFAIIVSYPGNCEEPYQIKNFWHNDLYNFSGHSTDAEVSVYDWQDDVDLVLLWCPVVTGEEMLSFSKLSSIKWHMNLTNGMAVQPGNYMGYIVATSQNSGATALYDLVEIVVKQTPVVEGNAIAWGGEEYDAGTGLVLDESGNMYVSGDFEETCDFDPSIFEETRTSNGSTDSFLVKYDQEWNLIWVQTWGGTEQENTANIGMDSVGNLYVAGDFAGVVDFNPGLETELHSSGNNTNRHIYLVKYNQDGVFLWAKTWGGAGSAEYQGGYDLLVNDADKIYVTGMFLGTCDFDPGTGNDSKASNSGTYDCFLSRFSPDGEYDWSVIWGGAVHEYSVAITDDPIGNLLIAGIFSGPCDFDPGPGITQKTPVGYYDAYVLKLNSSGQFRWVQAFGGDNLEYPYDIITDSESSVYTTGYFGGTTDLDPDPVTQDIHTSNGYADSYVSKLNSSGDYQWGHSWGGNSEYDDFGISLIIDDSGYVNVGGRFAGTVDFDPAPDGFDVYSVSFFTDIFLCSYDTDGNYQWVNTWGGIYADSCSRLQFHDGQFYLTGYFGQTCDFDPGTGKDVYTAAGYIDSFLLRYSR